MPWPTELLHTCFDAAASNLSGRIVFKWPYPDKDWQANRFYLQAMEITNKALNYFDVPLVEWNSANEDRDRFFQWIWDQTHPKVDNG